MALKEAVGYIRVSTDEQDEKYGASAQQLAIASYAQANGYKIVGWYKDTISGVKADRPEWNRIVDDLSAVRNPPVEAVIVFKTDRVARDIKLYFYYLYLLERRNIQLISTLEDFGNNLDNGLADIYRSLILFVAKKERENITIRTSAGRHMKARAGGYAGGRVPYGYTAIHGRLEIEPLEAEVVRSIFEGEDRGYSIADIARALNNMGYKGRSGSNFSSSTVRGILDRKDFYLGKYSYAGIEAVGQHKPILKEAPKKEEEPKVETDDEGAETAV